MKRPPERRPSRLRLPRARLLTRLLLALTLVFVVSFVVTFGVESNLTRNALRQQAEEVLDRQVALAATALQDRSAGIHSELSAVSRDLLLDVGHTVTRPQRGLIHEAFATMASRLDFTVINAYARDARERDLAHLGPQVVPPPDALYDELPGQWAARIVPTVDGRYAHVQGARVGDMMLVLGYTFDSVYAHRLREAAGGNDIVLFVDGEAVGTSLGTLDDERFDPGFGPDLEPPQDKEVITVGGVTYWAKYQQVGTPGSHDWGHHASLAVLVPEPLAALDRALLRNRLGAGAGLLALATLLAWVVSRRLTDPLRQLTVTASDIADGNLDTTFAITGEDEVGTLSRALEGMRSSLRSQVELIAQQAAALQNAARRIAGEQDEARRKLAGELHDGIQQQLVMLRLHLGFARERIRQDPGAVDDVMADLATEADTILSRLRETAQGIFPSILRDRGLAGALFSLAGRASSPVEVTITPDPLPRFLPEVEAHAYFLVAEAVSNAVKHADARRIQVDVRADGDELTVAVRDDGGGFDAATTAAGGGLMNLHDRVQALGGTLDITTAAGAGTEIVARLPAGARVRVAGTPQARTAGRRSVRRPLEVEQDGRDPSVEVDVLPESELAEDRIDVFLDGSF